MSKPWQDSVNKPSVVTCMLFRGGLGLRKKTGEIGQHEGVQGQSRNGSAYERRDAANRIFTCTINNRLVRSPVGT